MTETRCDCHRLLFRVKEQQLEIVCPKCKKFHTIPMAKLMGYQSHRLLDRKSVV